MKTKKYISRQYNEKYRKIFFFTFLLNFENWTIQTNTGSINSAHVHYLPKQKTKKLLHFEEV